MVQSSYKNRKKNRKQSFKRKNTDGNRKVKFIEDDDDNKMVGGDPQTDKTNIKTALNQYAKHPLFGIILAAFSNSTCASSDVDGQCSTDNMSALGSAYLKCKEILKSLPELSEDGHKKPQAPESPNDGTKLDHVKAVIDYLFQNVFIPKDSIQHVYVQNDAGTNWTTLTNTKFVEVKSETDDKYRAAAEAGEKKRQENTDHDDGEIGEQNDYPYDSYDYLLQQERALAPKDAVTVGQGQKQFYSARRKEFEDTQKKMTEDMSVQQSSVSGQQQQNSATAEEII